VGGPSDSCQQTRILAYSNHEIMTLHKSESNLLLLHLIRDHALVLHIYGCVVVFCFLITGSLSCVHSPGFVWLGLGRIVLYVCRDLIQILQMLQEIVKHLSLLPLELTDLVIVTGNHI